jgi:hypothetical protein
MRLADGVAVPSDDTRISKRRQPNSCRSHVKSPKPKNIKPLDILDNYFVLLDSQIGVHQLII